MIADDLIMYAVEKINSSYRLGEGVRVIPRIEAMMATSATSSNTELLCSTIKHKKILSLENCFNNLTLFKHVRLFKLRVNNLFLKRLLTY